jgi:hypothetical protein
MGSFAWFWHTRMHSPQSMQRSLIMDALPFRTLIACVGQRFMQLMQPLHLLLSSVTECKILLIANPANQH